MSTLFCALYLVLCTGLTEGENSNILSFCNTGKVTADKPLECECTIHLDQTQLLLRLYHYTRPQVPVPASLSFTISHHPASLDLLQGPQNCLFNNLTGSTSFRVKIRLGEQHGARPASITLYGNKASLEASCTTAKGKTVATQEQAPLAGLNCFNDHHYQERVDLAQVYLQLSFNSLDWSVDTRLGIAFGSSLSFLVVVVTTMVLCCCRRQKFAVEIPESSVPGTISNGVTPSRSLSGEYAEIGQIQSLNHRPALSLYHPNNIDTHLQDAYDKLRAATEAAEERRARHARAKEGKKQSVETGLYSISSSLAERGLKSSDIDNDLDDQVTQYAVIYPAGLPDSGVTHYHSTLRNSIKNDRTSQGLHYAVIQLKEDEISPYGETRTTGNNPQSSTEPRSSKTFPGALPPPQPDHVYAMPIKKARSKREPPTTVPPTVEEKSIYGPAPALPPRSPNLELDTDNLGVENTAFGENRESPEKELNDSKKSHKSKKKKGKDKSETKI